MSAPAVSAASRWIRSPFAALAYKELGALHDAIGSVADVGSGEWRVSGSNSLWTLRSEPPATCHWPLPPNGGVPESSDIRPVDTGSLSNKFKGLGVLRFGVSLGQSSGGLRAGSYGLARWQRGLGLHCSGAGRPRHPGCRDSRKATQDNQTPGRVFGIDHFGRARHGSPLVLQWRVHPAMADGYRSRSRGGWSTRVFAGERQDSAVKDFEFQGYATDNPARPLSEYRHHGAHRCR